MKFIAGTEGSFLFCAVSQITGFEYGLYGGKEWKKEDIAFIGTSHRMV
jgi:hypothetical protein